MTNILFLINVSSLNNRHFAVRSASNVNVRGPVNLNGRIIASCKKRLQPVSYGNLCLEGYTNNGIYKCGQQAKNKIFVRKNKLTLNKETDSESGPVSGTEKPRRSKSAHNKGNLYSLGNNTFETIKNPLDQWCRQKRNMRTGTHIQ